VEQGANVNAASGGRWTPLHYAARAGSLNVARYLVEQGANVNAAGADGRTPLRVAPNEETRASLRELGAKETGEEADGPRG